MTSIEARLKLRWTGRELWQALYRLVVPDVAGASKGASDRELLDLTNYLHRTSEQEKSDLGHSLHAVMGDVLTAARMDLAWVRTRLSAADLEILQKIQGIDALLGEAVEIERGVVEELRPSLLNHFGLPTALQVLFEESCRKANLKCSISITTNVPIISAAVGIALYRVAEEALFNVVQHANATWVHLLISAAGGWLQIIVQDDGRGIGKTESPPIPANGISSMRHRLEHFGGRFEIVSALNQGTSVRFSVPCAR